MVSIIFRQQWDDLKNIAHSWNITVGDLPFYISMILRMSGRTANV